jgi:hypothetical protein
MNGFSKKLRSCFSPDCNGILFSFSEKRYNGKQEIASKKELLIKTTILILLALVTI